MVKWPFGPRALAVNMDLRLSHSVDCQRDIVVPYVSLSAGNESATT